jgi:hypothetical protein
MNTNGEIRQRPAMKGSNMKSGSDNNIVTHSHSSDVGGRGAGGAETQRTHGRREGRGAGGAETQRTHGRREKAKNTKISLLFDKI